MKILFICGSVEPGKDGVGDYTLRLASELIMQGHQPGVISLNDFQITSDYIGLLEFNGVQIQVFRQHSFKNFRRNLPNLRSWVQKFNADWVSVQFVPFAFHPKGLSLNLERNLRSIAGKTPVHIMLHELWVGLNVEAPLKEKCWGWLQKKLIKNLLLKLKPVAIYTQTQVYKIHLKNLGFSAKLLPLFGNIPLSSRGKTAAYTNNCDEISLVIFGGVHPNSPMESFAKEAAQFCNLCNLKMNLTLIGRTGREQQNVVEIWNKLGIEVRVMGEQSVELISDVLFQSTFGLTTTPILLIEKSGSVAAMLEHGLPVICLSKTWYTSFVNSISIPNGVTVYSNRNIEQCFKIRRQGARASFNSNSLSEISLSFVSGLVSASRDKK